MKLQNKHTSSPKSALLGLELTVTVHHDDPETLTFPPYQKEKPPSHCEPEKSFNRTNKKGGFLTGNWVEVRVCVYTILDGQVHGQGEQAPLRPTILGCGARARF